VEFSIATSIDNTSKILFMLMVLDCFQI
jgi:hypothetical protein